jgi:hypothetical protein
MKALIVYESLWGNTEQVARAITKELARGMGVEIVPVDSAPRSVEDCQLLIVGGPTHAFSMTRATTRQGAVTHNGAPSAPEQGIREWLSSLPQSPGGILATTFDTRVDSPRLPGSAARAAKQELRSLGFDILTKQESFYVHGYAGPLVDGELDRATAWAATISTACEVANSRHATPQRHQERDH